jgi:Zn-dependent protease with chaperone function
VVGSELSREDAPLLWSHVESLATKIGALHPEHIIVGLDPNFFVTEAKVVCLSGDISGRSLYCSLPLCRILSKCEMSAVVGHELGHYKGKDTKFSKRFYPVYRGTTEAIASLHAAGGEGVHALALIPAIAVLGYFLQCFSLAEHRLGRERELAADAVGAGVTDASTMATALVKVHAFTAYWATLQEAAVTALKQGNIFVNASRTYAETCAQNAGPSALQGIADSHTSHPTDTHPSLGARLKNLQTPLQEVSAAALDLPPTDCAVEYITNYEAKEEEISESYQLLLAQNLGISLDQEPAVATAA